MRSVVHASFTITRHWKASPARVFAAFADEKQKDKWFAGPGSWTMVERSFDFREGGVETLTGKWNTGRVTRFHCVYRDIVPPIHVATTYERGPDGAYPGGRVYSRADNPSYDQAEALIASLEGAAAAMLFASGQAHFELDGFREGRIPYPNFRLETTDGSVPNGQSRPAAVRSISRSLPGAPRLIEPLQ